MVIIWADQKWSATTSNTKVWQARNTAFNRTATLDNIGGFNIGFPGQYWDSEKGSWYNYYRDYDPEIGRYLQSDPIGLAGGVNTYGYVGGDPVNLVDSLGLKSLCDALNEIAKNAASNPFLNGTKFNRKNLTLEDVPKGGGPIDDSHFTDPRNGLSYDVQYIQVGWSLTKSYGVGSANIAITGYMLGPLLSGDSNYFSRENLGANMRGLQLGEFGARRFKKFDDFVSDLCPKNCKNKR